MQRLTDRKIAKAMIVTTDAEKIYKKLAEFENAQEEKKIYTREQLSNALVKGIETLSEIMEVKITKKILIGFLAELKPLDGKINYAEVEKTAFGIINKVAK